MLDRLPNRYEQKTFLMVKEVALWQSEPLSS